MTAAELAAIRVTVVRRPADPARRRRLVQLLVDLLDKPTPDDARRP